MPPHPDAIADCVLSAFKALPLKCKPRLLPNGRREWVPLAGLVMSRNDASALTCISLSTGMKCLPHSKLGLAHGNILHDWHAEVLAFRGFNRWILDQCLASTPIGPPDPSDRNLYIQKSSTYPPFRLSDDVEGFYMYCTEAPCGDASMELTMAGQADITPWAAWEQRAGTALPGRGNFDRLGVVRRKPARADAPVTVSKSCSDKMALKQVVGLLGGLVSLVVEGDEKLFLKAVVLPEDRRVREAVERAWGRGGRMAGCGAVDWSEKGGYGFRPFEIWTTTRRFDFDKVEDAVSSNLSVMWTPQRQEVLINGVLQGRKQMDPAGRSSTSRRSMWEDVKAMAVPELEDVMSSATYADLKESELLGPREAVKRTVRSTSLRGWERNTGDEQWGIT